MTTVAGKRVPDLSGISILPRISIILMQETWTGKIPEITRSGGSSYLMRTW